MSKIFSIQLCFLSVFSLPLVLILFELCLTLYHSQTHGTVHLFLSLSLFFNILTSNEFLDFVSYAHLHKIFIHAFVILLLNFLKQNFQIAWQNFKYLVQSKAFKILSIHLANAAAAAEHKIWFGTTIGIQYLLCNIEICANLRACVSNTLDRCTRYSVSQTYVCLEILWNSIRLAWPISFSAQNTFI